MLHIEEMIDHINAGDILLYGHHHSLDLTIRRLQEYAYGYSFFRFGGGMVTCDYYTATPFGKNDDAMIRKFNACHGVRTRTLLDVINEVVTSYNDSGQTRTYGTAVIPKNSIILCENMDKELDNPEVQTKLQMVSEDREFQLYGVHFFFYSNGSTRPTFLTRHGTEVEIPGLITEEISKEYPDMSEVAPLLEGMPPHEIFTIANWRRNTDPIYDDLCTFIQEKRSKIISQSSLLRFLPDELKVTEEEIGGYDRCVQYLKDLGKFMKLDDVNPLDVPKGVAFAGIPGTGKSYLAKAVGGLLGLETICLDMTAAYRPLVGQSEEAIRNALEVVSQAGPCVLYLDEIDKTGAGNQGSCNDSGTSARVMGIFLSWLQDNRSGAFVVLTLNDLDALRPEFLRDGRFDRIFRVGLPSPNERLRILKCQCKRRGIAIDFGDESKVIEATKFFTGAEIEQALKDAVIESRIRRRPLDIAHFIKKASEKRPMILARPALMEQLALDYSGLTDASGEKNNELTDLSFSSN